MTEPKERLIETKALLKVRWAMCLSTAVMLVVAGAIVGTWTVVQALDGPVRVAVAGDPVVPPDMVPLNQDPPDEPPNLFQFVKNKPAAIKLGKAFFWDMQVGSDGVQACASCHFSAGADNRVKNTVNPGPDSLFQVVAGPNETITTAEFPFHQRAAPADSQDSAVLRDSNDRVGSQGVKLSDFVDVVPGSAVDNMTPAADPLFSVGGENMRRVTERNTPTVINAAFNLNNFWDGRASFIFNGENPFGPADQNAGVWFNLPGTGLVKQPVAIEFAGLASQATGPALDATEMSARGRNFPKLGQKMLSLTPLGKQIVHPGDSVLGPLSRATFLPTGRVSSEKGLNTTYEAMIQTAFQDNLWNSPLLTPEGYTQIEANFALFWGLSIQLYEATLVSDQTPFDRWLGGDTTAMTAQEKSGFNLFMGIANCGGCHAPPTFSEAPKFLNENDHLLVELMWVSDGAQVIYDAGFQNTGVTRVGDDIGRGGNTPFTNPHTSQPYPLSWSKMAELQRQGLAPFSAPMLPFHIPAEMRVNANGSFKVPGLRNVELTAPYFHNGSAATLEDIVDFYVRGGNFPAENLAEMDPLVGAGLPLLRGKDAMKADLVAFMKALTDPRVRNESGPFDHPELIIPNGDPEMIRIPARDASGNPALTTLTINPVVSPTTISTQTITGTVEEGLTPEVTVDTAATVGAVTVVGADWSVPVTRMPQALNTITSSVTDLSGVTTSLTTTIRVAPVAPVITSTALTTGTVGVAYAYDVNATDGNDLDTLTYSLAVSPVGMTINPETGMIAWISTALQTGLNNVSVRVTDTGGLNATQTFSVNIGVMPPPPSPWPIAPPAGMTVRDLTPRLSWNGSAGAVTYGVQVAPASDSRFAHPVVEADGLNATLFDVPTGMLSPGTQYKWRVRAENVGGFSNWSRVSTFRTPLGPTPPRPLRAGVLTNLTPTLSWAAVAGAVSYDVEVSSAAAFAPAAIAATGNVLAPATQFTVPAGLLNGSRTYFWHVRVNTALGTSRWSGTAILRTPFGPRIPPVLLSPRGVALSLTPTLEWRAAPGAASYEVQVATTSRFTAPLVMNQAGISGTTLDVVTPLNPGTLYFWRVRAVNEFGASLWRTGMFRAP